jgi:MATE family multidrug resistance protein
MEPSNPARRTIRWHVRATAGLALPVILGRISILALVAEDTAMTGRVGAEQLAFYGLATAPQVPMLLMGLGLLMGTIVLTAQAVGAGELSACGRVLRSSLVHAVVIGFLLAGVCQGGEALLALTGQTEELARGGGRVLAILGWGLPAALLFGACTFFLEGLYRPLPGMLIMVAANVLNIALNWILIYGNLGLPALGAEGAALATSLVRWFTLFAILAYIGLRLDTRRFGLTRRGDAQARIGPRLRRIGLPLSLAHGLESSAFSAMIVFAGWLGPVQVSTFQIAINLVALAFMAAVGFGSAASVRVGNAVGRGDAAEVRVAGWVAVGMAVVTMGLFAVLFYSFPAVLAGLYATDAAVIAVTVPTLTIAAAVLVADGTHGATIGALRATADVWPATALYLISFWLVMVPAGYVLGVRFEGGAPGLMLAVGAGAAFAAVLLPWRFRVVSRRAVARA